MTAHLAPSARLIGVIREMYGLDLGGHRMPALFDCLSAVDQDVERAANDVLRSPARLRELAECATNNETYFFRHAEQLLALQALVTQSLAENPRPSLRVWVAGCSSGEEALSIAAVLRDALASSPGTRLSVLGTDLHRGMLKKANSGYTMWSFRGVSPEVRAAHFVERDGRYEAFRALRALVSYRRHNLLEGSPEAAPFDVVSCRNVLIYFDAAMVARAIELLALAVRPGGYLLLGPAESPTTPPSGFETVAQSGVTVFRRRRGTTVAPPSPHQASRPLPPDRPARARPRPRGVRKTGIHWPEHPAAPPPSSPEAHVAEALAALESGDQDGALRRLHAVIVAEPDIAMAHYLVGSILESRGEDDAAEQYYRQSLVALGEADAAQPVSCGGGITVGELVQVLARVLHAHRARTST
jgi:chemotaxis methyl-accepting protein methylase